MATVSHDQGGCAPVDPLQALKAADFARLYPSETCLAFTRPSCADVAALPLAQRTGGRWGLELGPATMSVERFRGRRTEYAQSPTGQADGLSGPSYYDLGLYQSSWGTSHRLCRPQPMILPATMHAKESICLNHCTAARVY